MRVRSIRVRGGYLFVLAMALCVAGLVNGAPKVYAVEPDTFIVSTPDAMSELTTPTFEFEASDTATFECRLDAGSYEVCTSPYTTVSLSNGAHIFEVRATNETEETDATPATYAWTVSAIDGIYINDCEELQLIGNDENYAVSDDYVLANDIDCSDTTNWNSGTGWGPIGTFADRFSGTFDGDGHSITDLYINRVPSGPLGLFGYVSGGSFTDFTVTGSITNPSNDIGTCQGGVAGFVFNAIGIDGVTSMVNLSGPQDTGGGLVGCISSNSGDSFIRNSDFDGDVSTGSASGLIGSVSFSNAATLDIDNVATSGTVSSGAQAGGLIGNFVYAWDDTAFGDVLTISNAISDLDIFGSDSLGGLVGSLSLEHLGANISDSAFTGIIDSSTSIAGGLVGDVVATGAEANEVTISRSYANTGINVVGGDTGGLVGTTNTDLTLNIIQSYGAGIITATGDNIGGLVGRAEGPTNIQDSYADIALDGDSYIGGLIGVGTGTIIDRSFAFAQVSSTASVQGGLVASLDDGEINDSFAALITASTWPTTIGGLVGGISDSVITNSYTDTNIGNIGCLSTGVPEHPSTIDCTEIDEANYFFNNVSDQPMFSWDFADVWRTNSSFYPCLQWQDYCQTFEPQVQCEQPVATDVSIHGDCQLLVRAGYDYGETTWEARYKLASDSEYTNVTLDDIYSAEATVNGLEPYTEYYLEFRFTNNWGTGDWERIEFITIPSADEDGVPNGVEQSAPNNGDANNDGTLDESQSYVGAYLNQVNNKYIVVEVGSGCVLSDINTAAEAANAAQDSAYNYAAGLVSFSADCGSNGAQTTAKVYFYGQTKNQAVVRKYNPTTKTYITVGSDNNVQLQQTTIGGQTVTIASYNLKDGGNLDTDGLENGVIVDPIGLGVSILGAPNTGLKLRS